MVGPPGHGGCAIQGSAPSLEGEPAIRAHTNPAYFLRDGEPPYKPQARTALAERWQAEAQYYRESPLVFSSPERRRELLDAARIGPRRPTDPDAVADTEHVATVESRRRFDPDGSSFLNVNTPGDLARLHDNRGDEWEFWDICQEKIQHRKPKMNLVTVERQFDHKKITFYFTAEKRVDFRELVRDLAAVFRTRIELRQIGVRDEARLKGGLGVCGREFCCSTFLHEFVPVTLKMAKTQQLPLNPGKLSGPCGRLRCCMTYENEVYHEARRRLPKVGTQVRCPEGSGTVRKLDLLSGRVSISQPGRDGLQSWAVDDLAWDRGDDVPGPRTAGNGCPRNGGGNDGKAGH